MVEIKYKQFVIIPRKPKMSAGKIASQTAHATFMALEKQKTLDDEGIKVKGKEEYIFSNKVLIREWKDNGMCVIVLECPTQVELMNIATYCEQWNIPHHLYIDEGLTEIPMGTATAFATGVLTEDQFWVFEQLQLFNG